ncbi:MAG: branched-chain amino acid ABC transporter permease [Acidobacteria bacterium]|nr:branched-chain amino acid ABC transporter permease [Acidobacteriota bacterium]
MAAAAEALQRVEFRPSRSGWIARAAVMAAIALAIIAAPLLADDVRDQWIGYAAVYMVIGLSVNVITGHAGQISLGHQAFVGIGAFTSAYLVARSGISFFIALPVAGLTGAFMALVLGLVALRIRGLYLALVTLAFGQMTETTIFSIRGFTGGGAGADAPRPSLFAGHQAFAYLCLMVVAVFLLVDWRFVKSKAGRAIVSIRNDERVAASLGINVTAYKLFAFVLGGFIAGVGGSLFAHWNRSVATGSFGLSTALVWVLMTVVGGLGSRAGVLIGSAFFAVFQLVVGALAKGASFHWPIVGDVLVQTLSPLLGALLLLLTLTLFPGGIGQQLLPVRRWLAGGPVSTRGHHRAGAAATAAPGSEPGATAKPPHAAAGVPVPAARDEAPAEPAPTAGEPAVRVRRPRGGGRT